jgi:hypothetical protein
MLHIFLPLTEHILLEGPYTGRCSRQDQQSSQREFSAAAVISSRCHRPVYLFILPVISSSFVALRV